MPNICHINKQAKLIPIKKQTFRFDLKAKPNFMLYDKEAPKNGRGEGGFGKAEEERISKGI